MERPSHVNHYGCQDNICQEVLYKCTKYDTNGIFNFQFRLWFLIKSYSKSRSLISIPFRKSVPWAKSHHLFGKLAGGESTQATVQEVLSIVQTD